MADASGNVIRGRLCPHQSLAKANSWHIGGTARQVFYPTDLTDLQLFLNRLPKNERLIWLGLGSNVLLPDGELDATVIMTRGVSQLEVLDDETVRAEAGVTCAKMAKFLAKNGYGDGIFFAGIPGTVGGALAMNAGAFGGETWPHVVAVEVIDRKGNIEVFAPEKFTVDYRHVAGPNNSWFAAGIFKFPPATDTPEHMKTHISQLLKKRNLSQPIGELSCGSVFKNPPGDYAARLIEACGLKGHSIGAAQISLKHANFMINTGGATAKDMRALIAHAQAAVATTFGITLVPEVKLLMEEE